ncbi:MAG: glycosyltransferase family 2 protein [Gemmatimonadaceae bacterium]|nr:glycosyltransferase family 2 protein [Gemmatimonadaceae bacterium]
MNARPLISVVTPCFNEEGNVREMAAAVRAEFAALPAVDYEHLFIDNGSRDGTAARLRELAAEDPRIKVILNTRNFGQVRSGYHALLQTRGDAAIGLACDFQDPPSLIPQFVAAWQAGAKVVLGVKESAEESTAFFALRERYYRMLARISDVEVVRQATGFGLYDRAVVDALRRIDDPYPFFRGLLAEIGYTPTLVPYHQPPRARGLTSQNFWTFYDLALLGVVHHSKIPLRLAALTGFVTAMLSLLAAFGYLGYKLMYWDRFEVGVAPLVIGLFFLASIQLCFVGIVGEYIGAIWTQVRRHPHVFERERINF